MIKDEVEYLKYIMRDSFGKESSKLTELILLHGNCLTLEEILNLYHSEFRIIRNVLLTLLIYNILDFHIVYDNKKECVIVNEETKLKGYEKCEEKERNEGTQKCNMESKDMKRKEQTRTCEKKKNEKIYGTFTEKQKEKKRKEIDNVHLRRSAKARKENYMKTLPLILERYRATNGCHCEMCVCKIKRIEYFVIVPNIYILIRYPSILYHIHPTVIMNKTDTSEIDRSQINSYTRSYVTNKTINRNVPLRRANNCTLMYNFFFMENKKRKDLKEASNTYDAHSCVIEEERTEGRRVRNRIKDRERETETERGQDLFENENLLSYIEKVIIIRIAKKGRLTIDECTKDFHNDEYIKLSAKEISNISKNQLKLIFLNLLNKKFIQKCKYFNEHFCKRSKYLHQKQEKYFGTNVSTFNDSEKEMKEKHGTSPNDILRNDQDHSLVNWNESQRNATRNNNTMVQINGEEKNQHEELPKQKMLTENTLANKTQHKEVKVIGNANSVSSISRGRIRKGSISRKNTRSSKKKKEDVNNEVTHDEDIKQNGEENINVEENILSLLNMDMTNKSPGIGTRRNKIDKVQNDGNNQINNKRDANNNIPILKNKRAYHSDPLDHLDNPYTYFQVNNHMLSFLYLKQLTFDFITTLFRFNEITKCIFFYLMKNVCINSDSNLCMYENESRYSSTDECVNSSVNLGIGNNIGDAKNSSRNKNNNWYINKESWNFSQSTAAFVAFEEIENYVSETLGHIKTEEHKNTVLQNLNLLLKNSDGLIKVQQDKEDRYAVDFSNVLNLYKRKMLHKIIKKIAGAEGLRVWNFLTYSFGEKYDDDKYNDETISERVLIPVNNVRKILYNLLHMGFIKCHEWNGTTTGSTTNALTNDITAVTTVSISATSNNNDSSNINSTNNTNNTKSNYKNNNNSNINNTAHAISSHNITTTTTTTTNTNTNTNMNTTNTTNTRCYGKHALLFSSNMFLTLNKIKEHLFITAQKLFIRKYFENQAISNLYNKSFISGTDCDTILNNELKFGFTYNNNNNNNNLGNNSQNANIRQGNNINNSMLDVTNNNNKMKKNKKNCLAAIEYAVDYLEISLIKLDRLIFLFNS